MGHITEQHREPYMNNRKKTINFSCICGTIDNIWDYFEFFKVFLYLLFIVKKIVERSNRTYLKKNCIHQIGSINSKKKTRKKNQYII